MTFTCTPPLDKINNWRYPSTSTARIQTVAPDMKVANAVSQAMTTSMFAWEKIETVQTPKGVAFDVTYDNIQSLTEMHTRIRLAIAAIANMTQK